MRALLAILLLTATTTAIQAAEPRLLRVSLYPYIPDAAAAALTLQQAFERLHPDIRVEITLNPNYYSQIPADKGLLYEDADIHEIDSALLPQMLATHHLAPVPQAGFGPFDPLARQAATRDNHLVAVPHWMCADFLIYRADHPALGDAHTMADLQRALGPEHGLLMDLKGPVTLGEVVLNAMIAQGTTPILTQLRQLLALEPKGMGRSTDYDARGSFYARQFARRAGSAFVGYSELTHDVLDETATSCRAEDRCVTQDQIRITTLPYADNTVRPTIWVDMFAIDTRASTQTRKDAASFIRYATSLPAYESLLIPPFNAPPRYLLPATEAVFQDLKILQAAPLYPRFRQILDQGAIITTDVRDEAARLDAELPVAH